MRDAGPGACRPDLAGLTVLVVEDEAIVSFMVEDMLKECGIAVVLHASRLAEAYAILQDRRPDAAVLDVNLSGELAYPLAERLEADGIPFVFATGYGLDGIPPQWRARPVIQKPFQTARLAAALGLVLAR